MIGGQYILNSRHEPVLCTDLMEWGRWMQTADRTVKKDVIAGILISTVFLGLDHSFNPHAPAILFETMIFGGEHDQYQDRCSTWKQAEEMHQRAVDMVKGSEVEA